MNKETLPGCGYFTYLLKCADGTYYCGWTNNPARRLKAHNSGSGSRYTRSRRPVRLVYLECFSSRNEAMRREAGIKKLTRQQKEALIRSMPDPDL
ncbi:MAG: GIY-YIG nuclease family protein [Clostridia bacterium]|nr:GIY-YIG nuclease family protein [Clostridia bacterium]